MDIETKKTETEQMAADNAAPESAAVSEPEERGLSQGQFIELLKRLGNDEMDEMLRQAGLSTMDEVQQDADDAKADPSAGDAAASALTADLGDTSKAIASDDESSGESLGVSAAASDQTGLTPEKIAHLLKALGDDVINDMLEDAGLADEDALFEIENAGLADKSAKSENDSAAPADDSAALEEDSRVSAADGEAKAEDKSKPADDESDTSGNSQSADGEAKADDNSKPADEESDTNGNSQTADGEAKAEDKSKPADSEAGASGKKRGRRKGKATRRFLFVAIFVGILLLVAAVNKIYMSATLNSDDPIQYSEHSDEISAQEGILEVNEVTVKVPSDGSEEYSISYSWAEEDEQYPSVPHAISATYADKEGNKLYSITLYRNETVPHKDVPSGKTSGNWFDSWKTDSESDVRQERLKSGDLDGFYIYPKPAAEGEEQEYNNYSYYFAVDNADGISTYVIEGICIDPEYASGFPKIMDDCIKSISLKTLEIEAVEEASEEAAQ